MNCTQNGGKSKRRARKCGGTGHYSQGSLWPPLDLDGLWARLQDGETPLEEKLGLVSGLGAYSNPAGTAKLLTLALDNGAEEALRRAARETLAAWSPTNLYLLLARLKALVGEVHEQARLVEGMGRLFPQDEGLALRLQALACDPAREGELRRAANHALAHFSLPAPRQRAIARGLRAQVAGELPQRKVRGGQMALPFA